MFKRQSLKEIPQTVLLILHYRTCDLFILTSREIETNGEVEGFGIVFLEAGACGKPVIGARSGGIQDAVIDKMTGILVDPSDISGTSEAIIKLLSDEELRNRLGKNGKIRVEKELNMTVFAEKLQMVLTNNLHYDEKKD